MMSILRNERRAERHAWLALIVALAAVALLLPPQIAAGDTWTGDHSWDFRLRREYERADLREDSFSRFRFDRQDEWHGDWDRRDRHWSAPPAPAYREYGLGDIIGWVGQELTVIFVGTREQMSGGDVDFDNWYLSLEGTSFGYTQKVYRFRPLRRGMTDLAFRTQRGERYVYHVTVR